jgi:outer membrane protein assembly factor BamB
MIRTLALGSNDSIQRAVAVTPIMVAGTIHLFEMWGHAEIPLYQLFFVALGGIQIALGVLIMFTGRPTIIYVISIVATVSSLLLYAISRASLFPSLIESEPIEPAGLFTKIMEGTFLLIVVSLFRSSADDLQQKFALSRRTFVYLASVTMIAILIGQSSFTAFGSPFALSSFYGLNPKTSWSYDAGPGSMVSAPPALAGGVLYFGTLSPGSQYSLVALNSSTGSLVWRYSAHDLCMCSAPALHNGTLYMVMVDLGSSRESLYAFDAKSGLPEWNFSTTGGGYYVEKLQTPQVSSGAVFALLEGDHLYAVNSTSGKLLWEYGHGEQGLAPFAVDKGLVLVGSRYQNHFLALNAASGVAVWRVTTDSQFLGQPLAYGGMAYAVSSKGTTYAFDEATGFTRWTYASGIGVDEAPVIHDGVLYVRGMSGHGLTGRSGNGEVTTESLITAVDARSGELVWSAHDDGLGMSRVAIADGVVYSGTVYGSGAIYMYDANHGWFIGAIPLEDSVAWPPVVGNMALFFGTNQGKVYALEMRAPNILLT